MNWPNGLTVARLVLGPIVLTALLSGATWLSFGLFVVAMLTDLYDGYLARRSNRVTEFGRALDPLADKVLVGCVLVGFLILGLPYVRLWMVVTVLGRELLILGCRAGVLKSGEGFVTSRTAKLKTAVQMVWIASVLLYVSAFRPTGSRPLVIPVETVLWIFGATAVALTVISGAEYLLNGRGIARAETRGASAAQGHGRGGAR